MKKILLTITVFSSFLFSCGAEKQAKELLDSARRDSAERAQLKTDSIRQSDSINKAIAEAEKAADTLNKKDSAK